MDENQNILDFVSLILNLNIFSYIELNRKKAVGFFFFFLISDRSNNNFGLYLLKWKNEVGHT